MEKQVKTETQDFGGEASPPAEILFRNVASDKNIVEGEFFQDGKKHIIHLLAVPESNLRSYSYEMANGSLELQD